MTDGDRHLLRRDAAIKALLPLASHAGWTLTALDEVLGPEARRMFPGGPAELVAAYSDLADREMVAAAHSELAGQKLSERVKTLIAARLQQGAAHKAAIRRAVAILATPANASLAARCTARTVDTIWHAAGDSSADFSWYTKRAILAGVYTSTLLYWLGGERESSETLAFLDRRLAGVARIGRIRRRITERFAA